MELGELVRGAQDAMDRGDYRLATAASAHGVAAYPSCLAAHRILGEAHLELGDAKPATGHFERTLAVDPLNVVARLGLGVAAEEQKDYAAAYAHYLHAWEINPALDQVRDELVRLRGLLGVEDRLHPTRSGLAGIHARGGQLQRAANEWRAVLAVEPESRRARTSFAELLWRQGEDALAAVACRDALRGSPENARALAILADVERRRQGPGAEEFAERYRAVDPTGDVLKLLAEWRADVDLSFLVLETAPVDDFDFAAHAVPAAKLGATPKIVTNALAGNQIAAPDLWDTLVKDLSKDVPSTGVAPTLASGVEPFTWNDAGPDKHDADQFADLGIQPFDVDDLGPGNGSISSPFRTDDLVASTADIYTAALSRDVVSSAPDVAAEQAALRDAEEHDELAALFAPATDREVAPAMPVGAGFPAGARAHWGGTGDSSTKSGSSPNGAAGGSGGYDDLVDLGIEPFTFEGMEDVVLADGSYEPMVPVAEPTVPVARAAPPVAPSAPVVLTPFVDDASPQDPPVTKAVPPVFDDPFVTADGTIDLTRGWDDLDRSLAAATPSFDADSRYDDLAAELGVDGIVPFDANIPGQDDDAWAPLTEDDFGVVGSAPVAADRGAQDVALTPAAELAPVALESVPLDPMTSLVDVASAAVDGLRPMKAEETPVPGLEADRFSSEAVPTVSADETDWSSVDSDPATVAVEVDWASLTAPSAVEVDWSSLDAVPPLDDAWAEPARAASANAWPDDEIEDVLELSALDALMAVPEIEQPPMEVALSQVVPTDGLATVDDAALVPHAGFDDELMLGIPSQQSSGYTELLRHVDDEEPDEPVASAAGIDPFSNPDSSGEPLAFEDLLAVTSRDGTAPLVARDEIDADNVLSPFDFSETDVVAAIPVGDVLVALDPAGLGLDGLDPFNLDDLAAFPEVPIRADDERPAVADIEASSAGMDHADLLGALVLPIEDGLVPFDFEAALAEPLAELHGELVAEPVAVVATVVPAQTPAPEWSGTAGLGTAIGSVVWPSFVNQTSTLIDRDRGEGSLFGRLRSAKAVLVAAGDLVVDRQLVSRSAVDDATPVSATVVAPPKPTASPAPVRPVMSEQTRLDLMTMRVRLIDDADGAEEIARTVEKAVAEGLSDPLALRILGEAYLKLGRMEQAAAQFRQAMLARQRSR